MSYTADFETTTDENDCRVWAYALCEIGNVDNFKVGNSIDDFMRYISLLGSSKIYFHNLKFDGIFILDWLLKHGYNHIIDRKDKKSKTFSTLISNQGLFYSIEINFYWERNEGINITIYDSLKLLPFSVDEVTKAFKLPISKLEIDYKENREIGHELTKQEIDYIRNDVEIMARALHILFTEGMTKMTTGSNALANYKKIVSQKSFKKWFPIPSYDEFIRKSYRGGWTYCNEKYQNKDLNEGIVLDVNSLYPSVMYNAILPFGEGVYYQGEYEQDNVYNLYVARISCQFELKDGFLPTLQIKNNMSRYRPTDYLKSSNGNEEILYMTSVDLKLFFEHYEVINLEFLDGWKFKGTTGLFTDYIDYWINEKIQAKKDGNGAMYTLAKLMLNSLYGKFALNPKVQSKIPYMEDDRVKFKLGEMEEREPIYIPLGTFITAYAREKTITSAQKVYDRFAYADTDSLHLLGYEIPKDLEVDDYKLGAWKHESSFVRSRFIRQKTYIEAEIIPYKQFINMNYKDKKNVYYMYGHYVTDKVTCAGMPKNCKGLANWNNFVIGSSYQGKLKPKIVKGGVILDETDFTIKDLSISKKKEIALQNL